MEVQWVVVSVKVAVKRLQGGGQAVARWRSSGCKVPPAIVMNFLKQCIFVSIQVPSKTARVKIKKTQPNALTEQRSLIPIHRDAIRYFLLVKFVYSRVTRTTPSLGE